ncbi:pectinesterase 2.1-like [Magnolia sinica]|uniref:pectinesterase 2.1-like n=1 Tax=Magnolia sinica TaxID=86752 RepID=UPI002658F4AE|nr:pectinesterase 2.1-like [Magnolia sinica]
MALSDCMLLMDLSHDRLKDSVSSLDDPTAQSHANVHSWLSGVLTNHVTCSDGLHGSTKSTMMIELDHLMALASTSLAIINAISTSNGEELIGRRAGDFPSWITAKDRKLLESSPNDVTADVVVANDGSGKYKTVQEAVNAAPDNSKVRYVIYVKKGTYKEKVDVGKKKKNIMLVGDGMDSTIITGSLNFIDGTTTFNSATVAAVGDGFIAQDIWFQNTAGPEKHQAVALRIGADQSVINRCRIDAYQDTLYAHSLRQFYRDCSISGTVDFIFGNAAVVFQNCKLIARKPMSNQQNLVTAQGRTDPNQNTGTSVQNCEVIASSDLVPVKGTIPTYLGRPWKEYSRTVFMQSSLGDHIAPAGWLEWSGDFALKTLYYGEYANSGPGAGTSKRVNWPGYHVITDPNEALKFTVGQLIQGGSWLKSTGVAFTEGL